MYASLLGSVVIVVQRPQRWIVSAAAQKYLRWPSRVDRKSDNRIRRAVAGAQHLVG